MSFPNFWVFLNVACDLYVTLVKVNCFMVRESLQ